MLDFDNVKKAYFLGIGGIGVSAVARMFLHEGKAVSGSDSYASEITEELEKSGAKIFIGQDLEHIPKDTDLVIYSIALDIFAADFMKQVRLRIKNVISYPEALSVISKNKFTIAISGAHGKTTTTAMIAKVLIDAGLDPTVIVGSKLLGENSNFVAGKSKYFIVEACEYCRSFLQINPTVVCVTNIDADHLDYYKDIKDIKSAFKEFVAKVPKDGALVGNLNDEKIKEVFGSNSVAKQIDSSEFMFSDDLLIPGEHNKKNASIAMAVASLLDIDLEKAKESLKNFKGTWRRFEYKGETKKGAKVFDDYAHHPTEIEATISGAREKFPDKKIIAVFQPHLFSRTKALLPDFARALSNADEILLLPIYPAREVFDATISSETVVDLVGTKAKSLNNFEEAKEILSTKNSANNSDSVILIMGAGSIGELPKMIIK